MPTALYNYLEDVAFSYDISWKQVFVVFLTQRFQIDCFVFINKIWYIYISNVFNSNKEQKTLKIIGLNNIQYYHGSTHR